MGHRTVTAAVPLIGSIAAVGKSDTSKPFASPSANQGMQDRPISR